MKIGDRVEPKKRLEDITTEFLLSKCIEWHSVGSRVTCNPPVTDTDEDFLCLVEDREAFVDLAELAGFAVGGSDAANMSNKSTGETEFVSLKRDPQNLIATDHQEFFEKFMLATRIATQLNLLEKSARIVLFQAILYGNG